MASIDNRVVRMDFENAKFQAGVLDTLNSLKLLTQGIQNISGANGTKFDNIATGVENIGNKFTWLNAIGFAAINNLTGAAMNFGKNVINTVFDPLVEGGKRRALNIEQAKFQFKGLGMDVEASMNSAREAVLGTAYGLDEAAKVASILGTSGMRAGDEMTRTLRAVAGTAAMSGSSFMDVGDIFTDVFGKGRVQAEDFNRLAARGVGAAPILAKYLRETGKDANATEASVRDMASKGKIDAQTFADAMSDAFGEHATKANETYTGSLSNMRAAISRLGASFAAVKFEKNRQIFNALTPVIDAFATSFQPVVDLYKEWSELSGKNTVNAINAVKPFVEGLTPVFTNLSNGVRNIGRSIKSIVTPISDAFNSIFNTTGLTDKLLSGLTSLSAGFETLTSKMILSESAQAKIQPIFETLFSVLKGGVDIVLAVGRALGGVVDVLKNFGKGFTEAFEVPTKLLDSIKKIAGDISTAFQNVGASFEGFGSGFGRTVAGIVNGVLEIIGIITSWVSQNINFKDVLAGIFGVGLVQFIRKMTGLIDTIKSFFEGFKAVSENGASMADSIKETLATVTEAFSAFTSGVKVWSLVAIAGSIALLTSSLKTLSELDSKKLVPALSAMGVMFTLLGISLLSFTRIMRGFTGGGLITAGATLLLASFAIRNIARAVEVLGDIDAGNLTKGLLALEVVLLSLRAFLNKTNMSKANIMGAASLVIMAHSLNDIAEAVKIMGSIQLGDLTKGLIGLGAALFIFSKTLSSINGLKGFSTVKGALAIYIAAKSLQDIGLALEQIGSLPWDHIGKSLLGVGGTLAIFTIVLRALGHGMSFGAIKGAAAFLIASKALKDMGEYLRDVGALPWSQIQKGLGSMGWAIGGLTGVLILLGKTKPMGSILGAASLLLAAQSLKQIGEVLRDVGALPWSQIQKGLGAMGWAVGGLAAVLTIMGKMSPAKSAIASVAILIAVQALDKIAQALKSVGNLSWDDILHGLSGLGGVLAELAIVIGVLGTVAPVGGILGATAILIVVQSLDKIADALKNIGSMSWGEIWRGLVGLGGALAELAIIVGVLGTVAPLGGFLGSGAILLGVQGLGKLADEFKKFGAMSWGEISRGLVGMGGALAELAIITGALGMVAGLPALLGAGSILVAVQGLGDIADALKKFGEMSWGDIGRGLSAMGGALGVIALGSLANTLSIIGAMSIEKVAAPLGVLADSVKKWANVKVPDGLAGQLSALAKGVRSWTFAWLGAQAIAAAAAPLGTLADSVQKWAGVTVPEGMEAGLRGLARGVQAWSWALFGGVSMNVATKPLGQLADSVKKWSGVSVPSGMEENLKSLSRGVLAWSWALFGGVSMNVATKPLGDLAGSIQKWNGVEVPSGMEENLKSLSRGVLAWSWALFGGVSMHFVSGPLGDLANTVKKWKDVEVPSGMEKNLKSLADGINHWWTTFGGGFSMGASTGPLGDLAGAVKKWKDVTVPPGMEANLKSLAKGIQEFGWFGKGANSMANAVAPVRDMAESVKKWNGVNVISGLGEKLTSLSTGIKSFEDMFSSGISIAGIVYPLAELARSVQAWTGVNVSPTIGLGLVSLGMGLTALVSVTGLDTVPNSINGVRTALTGLLVVTSLAVVSINGINGTIRMFSSSFTSFASNTRSGASSVQASISSMVQVVSQRFSSLVRSVRSFSQMFSNELRKLGPITETGMRMVVSGISSATPSINSAARGMVSGMIHSISSAIRGQAGAAGAQAASIGYAISAGMARGIYNGSGAVIGAARSTALRALNAAKAALGVASPSKEMTKVGQWFDAGLVRGILGKSSSVSSAGRFVSNLALDAAQDAISSVASLINSEMDTDPVIKPLVDLSDVEDKYSRLATLMSINEKMNTTGNLLYSAARGYDRNEAERRAGAEEKAESSKSFNYTQNNYSPKALSAAEIYRKTKNQLSISKGELDLND